MDAHLVETTKAEAKVCYEGYRAYQPMEVVWAETGLVVADEFRAGNVPASKDIRRMVDAAYAAPRRIEGVPTKVEDGLDCRRPALDEVGALPAGDMDGAGPVGLGGV